MKGFWTFPVVSENMLQAMIWNENRGGDRPAEFVNSKINTDIRES